jgi:hypothetical protein
MERQAALCEVELKKLEQEMKECIAVEAAHEVSLQRTRRGAFDKEGA